MSDPGVIVVGAGESGARLALALRANAPSEPIALLGEEPIPPYERPPLSKDMLTQSEEPAAVWVASPSQFEAANITTLFGVNVVTVETAERRLITRAHGEFRYRKLVLATGAVARRLSCEGGEYAPTLRSFADAVQIRRQLRSCASVVVIGGGFIGLEVAASARKLGVAVTVVESAARLLSRAVPDAIAAKLADRHVRAGVELLLGSGVVKILPDAGRYIVELADGRALTADLVVAGVGSVPRTELASDAGLVIENGVAVDGGLQTSDPDVYALGDCCSFPHSLYENRRVRLESWRSTRDQAEFLAKRLVQETGVYAAVPWFWSDQYELHLQVIGLPSEGDDVVRRQLDDGAVLDFHLNKHGRLVAASALGALETIARDARIAEKLIGACATPDRKRLADPIFKLRMLLSA